MINGKNCISIYDNKRPQLSFILYIIDAGSNGNKNTYFNSVNTGGIVLIGVQHK